MGRFFCQSARGWGGWDCWDCWGYWDYWDYWDDKGNRGNRGNRGEALHTNKKSGRIIPSASSVIRLGLEGADAPSRAPCLHPPNPLGKGALLGSSPTYQQKKRKDKSFRSFGDSPGARTQDPSIKSAVLYQLS